MKILIWKLRFAMFFVDRTVGWSLRDAFDYAGASAEAFGTDMHPSDAVNEELSCWSE